MTKSLKEALLELELMEVEPLPLDCAGDNTFEEWLRSGTELLLDEDDLSFSFSTDLVTNVTRPTLQMNNSPVKRMQTDFFHTTHYQPKSIEYVFCDDIQDFLIYDNLCIGQADEQDDIDCLGKVA